MKDKELDKLFESAKGEDNLIAPNDAENIINNINKAPVIGGFLRRNKMNLVIASIMAISVIAGASFFSNNEDAQNEIVIIQEKNDNKLNVTEEKSKAEPELTLLSESDNSETKEIIQTNVEANKSNTKPSWVQKEEKLEVEGVNAIELSLDELENLGVKSEAGKKLVFTAFNNTNNPIQIKLTPTNYDWGTRDESNTKSISPVFITDARGNKRISLYSEKGFTMIESNNTVAEDPFLDDVLGDLNSEDLATMLSFYKENFDEESNVINMNEAFQKIGKALNSDDTTSSLVKLMKKMMNAQLAQEQAKEQQEIALQKQAEAKNVQDQALLLQEDAKKTRLIVHNKQNPGVGGDTTIKTRFTQKSKIINDSSNRFIQNEMVFNFEDKDSLWNEFAEFFEDEEVFNSRFTMNFDTDSTGDLKNLFANFNFPDDSSRNINMVINNRIEFSDEYDSPMKIFIPSEEMEFTFPPNSDDLISKSVEDFVDINKLIPISVKFDGVNTDYLLWFEPTGEFIDNLPLRHRVKLTPEVEAIAEETALCGPAPTEDKAVMDVWRGCSGVLKNLKVYPNPATTNITAEFDLEDLRSYKLTINNMNGKVVKSFQTEDILNNFLSSNLAKDGTVSFNGPQTINLDLTGIESGMYYVVVETAQGEQAMQRLIINK